MDVLVVNLIFLFDVIFYSVPWKAIFTAAAAMTIFRRDTCSVFVSRKHDMFTFKLVVFILDAAFGKRNNFVDFEHLLNVLRSTIYIY